MTKSNDVPWPEPYTLLVGVNDKHEVVINHPNLDVDENGCGYLVFSPEQARNLAYLLLHHAQEARYSALQSQPSTSEKPQTLAEYEDSQFENSREDCG